MEHQYIAAVPTVFVSSTTNEVLAESRRTALSLRIISSPNDGTSSCS